MFSTLGDGKIVKGLAGVPTEGPVLFVGYHMLMGLELFPLVERFLSEKNIMVRGLAHPNLFLRTFESSSSEFFVGDWVKVFGGLPVTASNFFKLLSEKSHVLLYPGGAREALHYKGEEYNLFWPDQPEFVRMAARFGAKIVPFGVVGEDDIAEVIALCFWFHNVLNFGRWKDSERTFESSSSEFFVGDWVKVFGGLPVTASNLFKLLSEKSHVLLYPGGAREALHYKGEEYKLFWPDQPEFVRMAARFGAKIVPFGVVGEDDIAEMVLDYHDLIKIPVVNDFIRDASRNTIRVRDKTSGEVANQELFIPGLLPKIPGRFYYLFGKPIEIKGRKEFLKDKELANQLYLQIKSEVESNMAFLIKKREEDPYRSVIDRTLYKALYAPSHEVPTFEP
ncbi:hypothetical protein CJ030_MR8G022187 [Morella rubra]|uniref:Acyltransferase n=1 Tax=Morella rubra TaxID=262757 RepID=A0A6A1UQZ3_9ROSI|nr:hypothetical protein CJ030_MR8G022187 [Morella rubra]